MDKTIVNKDNTATIIENNNSEATMVGTPSSSSDNGGRYSITRTLGKGAMGVVYLAHDTVLERDVAIKELHANLSSDLDLMERFRREAKVLAKMTHAGIVQIYDLVVDSRHVWIVMEFVKGQDLSENLKSRGKLPVDEVFSLGAQLAEALAYAHSLGIVHRDFKPGNVLITERGVPKIMDFGLAKLAQSAQHTAAGTILGTPAYMSPEQAAGKEADARSDIYSLGIVLYHLAAGILPFKGELASIIAQHINTPPKPPKEIAPEIPDNLQDIILKLLEKDPSNRIQDMATVAGMLRGTISTAGLRSSVEEPSGSGSGGIGNLLEQKEKLERMIKEQFSRHICVMFTDLKGSTAIADLQGDLAARMIIKKHIDILAPIIREHGGKLVKTMGDGTMSYYEHEIEAVRAAVKIQKGINAYNDTIEGQAAIRIRVGISSGNAFVEDNDIFGDVVNVSSRFESSCEPSEIYISESTYDALGENKEEHFIRHIRNITFKGKSTPSKVFKVFYKPEEIEKEKKNPTNPEAVPVPQVQTQAPQQQQAQEPEKVGIISTPGLIFAKPQRPSVVTQAVISSPKLAALKQEDHETMKELKGGIMKQGEVVKLEKEKYRVTGDIIVAKGAVLNLNNVELYFAENAGIVAMGIIRAAYTTFTAIDPYKGWKNVVISAEGEAIMEFDNCKFFSGKGRTAEDLKSVSDVVIASPQTNITYGGGLLISGGSARALRIKQSNFYKCSAGEGGGIYFYRSQAQVDSCLFEGCIAKTGNGGGISTFSSDITIHNCSFSKCSSGNNGGGAAFTSSKNTVEDSVFRTCLSKIGGGGIACISSDPNIKNCQFEGCVSKNGGGIFNDGKKKPGIEHTSFMNCKPNDRV